MKTKILILFLLSSIDLFSQDLYSHDNSVKFGEYLYNSNQYDLAIREFERCVYLKSDDKKSYLYLFKIYRKSNAFDKAIDSYKRFSGSLNLDEMDSTFASEYFKLLIQNEKYHDADNLLMQNSYFKENSNLKLSIILLKKDWVGAEEFKNDINIRVAKSLADITDQGFALKKRSPVMAGLFSAIIPGAGKIYAGKWKDGVISFLMTSTSAFLAVRAYNQNKNGIYPWVIGTMSIAYYSGNIYGSSKAVLKYNKEKEDELVKKTSDFILGDY